MDTLWYGLKVALVGMVVVFIGLIILIGCIKALKSVGVGKEQPPEPPSAGHAPPEREAALPLEPALPPVAAAPPLPVIEGFVPGPALKLGDDALYVVLSAAVGETLAAEGINPEGGFAIRSIKPVDDPAAPKLTPKDNAFYAILTAVIGETLAAEGVDPENGFVIRSVQPA